MIDLEPGERLQRLNIGTSFHRVAGTINADVLVGSSLETREVWKCPHAHRDYDRARACAEEQLERLAGLDQLPAVEAP